MKKKKKRKLKYKIRLLMAELAETKGVNFSLNQELQELKNKLKFMRYC